MTWYHWPIAFLFLTLTACISTPEGIAPVSGFEQERYLGKWYEVARIDNRFERELSNVTASYSVKDNGDIRVLNRGYKAASGQWSTAEGKAKFVGAADTAHLKVSFFGPIYGSYIVFELGPDYQYSFVTGNDRSYLWFLSRSLEVSPELKETFLTRITELGFKTDNLIWVEHDKVGAVQP